MLLNSRSLLDEKSKKVKERMVLTEIYLRTTGRHLSMGSHSVSSHPTDPVRMKG